MSKFLKSFNHYVFCKILIACLFFAVISCTKDSDDLLHVENPEENELKCSNKQGKLLDYELVNSMTAEQIVAAVGPAFASLIQHDVKMYKVSYLSVYKGNLITVSGIVGTPDTPLNHKTTVVMYNHGTRVSEADHVPSSGLDLLTVVAAANGKICFAADYVGFGDSKQFDHPYVINSETVYPILDMIIAGKQFLRRKFKIKPKLAITMFGYSQGGSATMAAQKELENNPYYRKRIHLKGVAMGTGPYDLLDNCVIPIIASETYSGMAYLPYLFTSYNNYYELNVDLDDIFKNSYGQLFLDMVDQNYTFNEINAALPVRLDEVLQDDFRADFLAGNTPFNLFFDLNASYRDWVPKSRTKIYHSVADEIVPFANAEIAYNSALQAGAKNVELVVYENLSHVGTAFTSIFDLLKWADE